MTSAFESHDAGLPTGWLAPFVAAFIVAVAVADRMTPLGYVEWMFYVLPIGLAALGRHTWLPVVAAFASALLLALGWEFGRDTVLDGQVVLVNRGIGIAVVSLVGIAATAFVRTRMYVARESWLRGGETRLQVLLWGTRPLRARRAHGGTSTSRPTPTGEPRSRWSSRVPPGDVPRGERASRGEGPPMLLLSLLACTDGTSSGTACEGEPIDRWVDADGDGFGSGEPERTCAESAGYADQARDCDDGDSAVHPGVAEACNGRDDDCNGGIDDALDNVRFYTDADGDGFGVRYPAQVSCNGGGAGWSRNADDCDDSREDVSPAGREICNGGTDDDCNGVADDNDAGLDPASVPRWHADTDADGFGNPDVILDRCLQLAAYVADATDCDDGDDLVSPAAAENPGNGIDENCNLLEGCYEDRDDDGARTDTWTEVADRFCTGPERAPAAFPLDCDDTDPGLTVDVGWYVDNDGDGFGSGNTVVFQCTDPGGGLVPESDPLDCADGDPDHGPATPEICDDQIDQDCDLLADCDDSDCSGGPGCLLPCADEALGPNDGSVSGNTMGRGDDLTPGCGASNSPDVAFQWIAPADGLYTFDTQGSAYDTVLAVRDGCSPADLACNDDSGGVQSMVQVQATAGQVLLVIVDGYGQGNAGPFVLNIY